MPDYRLCILDPTGVVRVSREFFARDDDIARVLSQDAAQDEPAQLWRGARLIAVLPDAEDQGP